MSKASRHRVAVIGGDGIGPEVCAEALKVVAASGVVLDTTDFDLGAARYLRDGTFGTVAPLRLPARPFDASDRGFAAQLAEHISAGELAECLDAYRGPADARGLADTPLPLAAEAGLPTVCGSRKPAEQGCLIGYGPDLVELRRQAADDVAHLSRRLTCRVANPGTNALRLCGQFEDRRDARAYHAVLHPRPRQRGHRMTIG